MCVDVNFGRTIALLKVHGRPRIDKLVYDYTKVIVQQPLASPGSANSCVVAYLCKSGVRTRNKFQLLLINLKLSLSGRECITKYQQ